MKKRILLFIIIIKTSSFLIAQKTDTIPSCYCDCIDTSKIIGDKAAFFVDFELKYLKTTLKSLQLLDAKARENFFISLYKDAYLKEQHKSSLGDYYVYYPPSPICDLVEKKLWNYRKLELKKEFYPRIADSLGLNDNIENLKYRIWYYPSFGSPTLLEIHINPNNIDDNKAIRYNFNKIIFPYMEDFEIEITTKEILEITKKEWIIFTDKTATYDRDNLPNQWDEIGFRMTMKDGYSVLIEVYEAKNLVHIVENSNPMKEGSERYNKNFRAFLQLTSEMFDWLPFKLTKEY